MGTKLIVLKRNVQRHLQDPRWPRYHTQWSKELKVVNEASISKSTPNAQTVITSACSTYIYLQQFTAHLDLLSTRLYVLFISS